MRKGHYRFLLGIVFAVLFLTVASNRVFSDAGTGNLLSDTRSIPKSFIRRQDRLLVVGEEDRPILLQGVCFGNSVWSKPSNPPVAHHSETDFQRVRDMHMNVIRFYLNYQLFEDDAAPYRYKQSGWNWLDTNIAWAKKYGIYLILNIHVPQGGFQSNGDGMALWNEPENQRRLIELWRAIAARYKDEPAIAGYDLLNEPVTSASLEQWRSLALRLVEAVRSVDRNHLIIIERMNGVKGRWTTYNEPNFFLVNDANTMYTFHFYSPIEYTHQNTSWTGLPPDGGAYPDPNIVMAPSDAVWYTATFNNPVIPKGNSPWTYYEGVKYRVTDPKILVGKPALVAQSVGRNGSVFFDDFVIKEYDQDQVFVRDIWAVNVTSADGWWFWSNNGSGRYILSTVNGHNDHRSLKIFGTTDDANCSSNKYRFAVKPGYYYQICGWIKGENIAPGARCQLRIDFETSPSGGRLYVRDKEYLEAMFLRFLDFGAKNNVPMYLGEFGVYKECFLGNKGGLRWVTDVIDILKTHKVHFTYHAYHESAFGIYRNDSGLPDPAQANNDLINLFKNKL